MLSPAFLAAGYRDTFLGWALEYLKVQFNPIIIRINSISNTGNHINVMSPEVFSNIFESSHIKQVKVQTWFDQDPLVLLFPVVHNILNILCKHKSSKALISTSEVLFPVPLWRFCRLPTCNVPLLLEPLWLMTVYMKPPDFQHQLWSQVQLWCS